MRGFVNDIIEQFEQRGKICFTLTEIEEKFSSHSSATLKRTLTRLTAKGKIASVWKGFYVIVPIEFQSKGIVPDVYYIDQLMKFLGKDYYISMLNAAEYYGAAHQKPQELTVITTPPSLRSTQKKGSKINFHNKAYIHEEFTEQRKTKTSYIKISSPELTAMDLIQFEKVIGGINRAATVLSELTESCNFAKLPAQFFKYVPTPVIQRLGYILEEILDFQDKAEDLHSNIKKYVHSFRKTPLKYRKAISGCATNKKWNVIINEQIEIDEI